MRDGGQAFPMYWKSLYHGEPVVTDGGMTLRDYFAAAALPAVISEYSVANYPAIGTDHILRNCPIIAYAMADAMLVAREAK